MPWTRCWLLAPAAVAAVLSLGAASIAAAPTGVTSHKTSSFDGDMLLQTPAPNATIGAGQTVSFSWSAAPYGEVLPYPSLPYQIQFQVASDSGFSSLVVNAQATCASPATCQSSTSQGPFPPGVYYWRITSTYEACLQALAATGAINSGQAAIDSCGPKASAVQSFTVTAPTATTTTTSPAPTTTTATPTIATSGTQVPVVRVLGGSTGKLGRNMSLRFTLTDDGMAAVSVWVFRGTVTVWKRAYGPQAFKPGQIYVIPWRPTRTGSFKFCLIATASPGRNTQSCAGFSVSK